MPRSDSIEHAGLGTALNSTGTNEGYFAGVLDEARVWNVARSQADIQATMDQEVTSGTGLVARWGMNEGSGTSIASSVGTFPGTLTSGPAWVAGFVPPVNEAPVCSGVALTTPLNTAGDAAPSCTDANGDPLTYAIVGAAGHGTASVVAGQLHYVPAAGYTGGDSFTYRASDGSLDSNTATATVTVTAAVTNYGLQLNGTSQYVTFGPAPGLDAATFTLETWFKWTGGGTSSTTGTDGIPDLIPLLAKGAPEVDSHDNRDEDYILGIRLSTAHLAADFEEGATGTSPSQNHPVEGSTAVTANVWHHAAATYDGSTWKLYLDGALDGTLAVGQPTRADSIQWGALGTMLTSTGATNGFFAGVLDEARVWNVARSQADIQATMDQEVTSGTGLVARWGMNEGSGTSIASSVGTFPGTLTSGPAWVAGAPFTSNAAPNAPALVSPGDGGTGLSTSPTLDVTVTDPDANDMSVTFYGRPVTAAAAPDFTIVTLPDTQNYTTSTSGAAIFNAQTQWIVDSLGTLNTKVASHLGDTVNDQADASQWTHATGAMAILDGASVPYGISPGNHDLCTDSGCATYNAGPFDAAFPLSKYSAKAWYTGGGAGAMAGREYRDSYQLFSDGSLDFIVINLEVNPPSDVVAWADGLLTTYASRQAIIVTHDYLTGSGTRSTVGGGLWTNLVSGHCNVFMVLSGHASEEAQLTSTRAGSCQPVYQVLQDYQGRTNGGDGWLRYYTFKPSLNRIDAFTWKVPQGATAGSFETDANSQFSLAYPMSSTSSWQVIGTATGVHSGDHATVSWNGLASDTPYEWYASVSDGSLTTSARPGRSRPPHRLRRPTPSRARSRHRRGRPANAAVHAFSATRRPPVPHVRPHRRRRRVLRLTLPGGPATSSGSRPRRLSQHLARRRDLRGRHRRSSSTPTRPWTSAWPPPTPSRARSAAPAGPPSRSRRARLQRQPAARTSRAPSPTPAAGTGSPSPARQLQALDPGRAGYPNTWHDGATYAGRHRRSSSTPTSRGLQRGRHLHPLGHGQRHRRGRPRRAAVRVFQRHRRHVPHVRPHRRRRRVLGSPSPAGQLQALDPAQAPAIPTPGTAPRPTPGATADPPRRQQVRGLQRGRHLHPLGHGQRHRRGRPANAACTSSAHRRQPYLMTTLSPTPAARTGSASPARPATGSGSSPTRRLPQLLVRRRDATRAPPTILLDANTDHGLQRGRRQPAPVAVADSYTTAQDTAKIVAGPGVLGNDTDSDGDPLTAVLNANVAHGVLALSTDGGFTYTPSANYSGSDSFTYHASDGTASSNIVTVSLTVTGTYYVDKTNASCSDAGAGTLAAPFCTIGKGASVVTAGKTVRVLAGSYAETVNGPNSGTAGSPITYSAAPGVTVSGSPGNSTNGGAFRITSKSYIVVDGFTITGTADYGIILDTSDHITISNNHVSYSGTASIHKVGIYLRATTESVVSGNTSDHNTMDGIRLNTGANYNTVSNNTSFANAEGSVRNACGIDVLASNFNTISHNITYANEDTGLNFYTGSHDNLVIGNLTYGNGDHGIDNNAAPNQVIVGNTVQGNVTVGINIEGAASPGSGGATVANNVMVDNGLLRLVGGGTSAGSAGNIRVDAQSQVGTTLDYNLYYLSPANGGTVQVVWQGFSSFTSLAAFKTAVPGQETHGVQANPLLTAPAVPGERPPAAPFNVAVHVGDYHLTAGSPAIDSANSNAPSEPLLDITGHARVDDPATANTGAGIRTYDDRGAYEYTP